MQGVAPRARRGRHDGRPAGHHRLRDAPGAAPPGLAKRLSELDSLARTVLTARVTQEVLLDAAALWAEARRAGRKTADDRALDIDTILCAQVRAFSGSGVPPAVLATTNVRHLAPVVDARLRADAPVLA